MGDLIGSERKGDDFPIARGDYVLVAERVDPITNRARPIKVAYKPSFLDRLPGMEEEWDEAVALDGEAGAQVQEDGQGAVDGGGDVDERGDDVADGHRRDTTAVEG